MTIAYHIYIYICIYTYYRPNVMIIILCANINSNNSNTCKPHFHYNVVIVVISWLKHKPARFVYAVSYNVFQYTIISYIKYVDMCIYVCVYIYIYICVYVHTCVYINIYASTPKGQPAMLSRAPASFCISCFVSALR